MGGWEWGSSGSSGSESGSGVGVGEWEWGSGSGSESESGSPESSPKRDSQTVPRTPKKNHPKPPLLNEGAARAGETGREARRLRGARTHVP